MAKKAKIKKKTAPKAETDEWDEVCEKSCYFHREPCAVEGRHHGHRCQDHIDRAEQAALR